MKTRIVRTWFTGLVLALPACTGQIGGFPGTNERGPGTTAGGVTTTTTGVTTTTTGVTTTTTGGVTTGGSASCAGGQSPTAPALHARLLSPSQYDNTVLDLLNVGGDPAKDFTGGAGGELDDLGVERRANAAASIAHQAALTLAMWSPCVPRTIAAAACEQQLIDKIGPAAYRHPLAAPERTVLQTLFDAGVKEQDFATGVEWMLTGVLQTPMFLYQFARVAPGEDPGRVRPLGAYEIASRLSYFVWDSMPDDALFAAAASDDLGETASVAKQLDRMVKDPRFMRGVEGFYGAWLLLDGFREVARDDKGFTSDVVSALRTSLLMTATQLYASAAPDVAGLFTGQTYYFNDALRGFYGVAGAGSAFTATDLPSQSRRGVLTHPALMALLARPNQSFPIARGLFIRQKMMCQDIPPPPDGLAIPPLADVSPGKTTRDRLDQHVTDPLCAACHTQFDPPGFALENFDQVGRYRTLDNGKAVDSSGTILNGGDVDGDFVNGDALLQKIAASQDVKACFAQQYFEFAMSRPVAGEDACSVDRLQKTFVPSGDLKALVASIATSDSFRYRMSEGGQP